MQATLSVITSASLIPSGRVCSWNAKMIFVSSKHIFLVQNISNGEQKNCVFLLNTLKNIFSVTHYCVGVNEQKFILPMFYFLY